jgi:hypothetical protein
MAEQSPHSKDLRLHRESDASATFFITKTLQPKKPILDAPARANVVSAFRFVVNAGRIYLRARNGFVLTRCRRSPVANAAEDVGVGKVELTSAIGRRLQPCAETAHALSL